MTRTIRSLLLTTGLCLFAFGCQPAATPFAKYDLGDGRYNVEIEDTGGNSSMNFESHSEGTDVIAERFNVSWGAAQQLVIENGKLSMNGEDRGTLEPGDQIVINKAGELRVNGQQR
jgi:hypothetical protein